MQIFLKEFDHATTLKRLILNQNKIHKNGKGWFGGKQMMALYKKLITKTDRK